MKFLQHSVSDNNEWGKLLYKEVKPGKITQKVEGNDQAQTSDRTKADLASLGKDVWKKDSQNKIRDAVTEDLNAKAELLQTKIEIQKGDTLGALAFGVDRKASYIAAGGTKEAYEKKQKEWQTDKKKGAEKRKAFHANKALNISWNTKVDFYGVEGNKTAESGKSLKEIEKTPCILPGQVVSFEKTGNGNEVVIKVQNTKKVEKKADAPAAQAAGTETAPGTTAETPVKTQAKQQEQVEAPTAEAKTEAPTKTIEDGETRGIRGAEGAPAAEAETETPAAQPEVNKTAEQLEKFKSVIEEFGLKVEGDSIVGPFQLFMVDESGNATQYLEEGKNMQSYKVGWAGLELSEVKVEGDKLYLTGTDPEDPSFKQSIYLMKPAEVAPVSVEVNAAQPLSYKDLQVLKSEEGLALETEKNKEGTEFIFIKDGQEKTYPVPGYIKVKKEGREDLLINVLDGNVYTFDTLEQKYYPSKTLVLEEDTIKQVPEKVVEKSKEQEDGNQAVFPNSQLVNATLEDIDASKAGTIVVENNNTKVDTLVDKATIEDVTTSMVAGTTVAGPGTRSASETINSASDTNTREAETNRNNLEENPVRATTGAIDDVDLSEEDLAIMRGKEKISLTPEQIEINQEKWKQTVVEEIKRMIEAGYKIDWTESPTFYTKNDEQLIVENGGFSGWFHNLALYDGAPIGETLIKNAGFENLDEMAAYLEGKKEEIRVAVEGKAEETAPEAENSVVEKAPEAPVEEVPAETAAAGSIDAATAPEQTAEKGIPPNVINQQSKEWAEKETNNDLTPATQAKNNPNQQLQE